MENRPKWNRGRWVVQFAIPTGLALLFLAALLWGLRGVTPARAAPGTLYYDLLPQGAIASGIQHLDVDAVLTP